MSLSREFPNLAYEYNKVLNDSSFDTLSRGSKKKVWWTARCGHTWEAQVYSRTKSDRPTGCPFCSNPPTKILAGFNDLATRHPEIAQHWAHDLNNGVSPSQVFPNSNTKYWWRCDVGHEWEATPNKRFIGRGCPVCAGSMLVPGENDLASCFPEEAELFASDLNGRSATTVFKMSNTKYWWRCEKGHEWSAAVCSLTGVNKTRCPTCSSNFRHSRGEFDVLDFVRSLGFSGVQSSVRGVVPGYELDVYVPEKNTAIEFNGLYWHSEKRDKGRRYHYSKAAAVRSAGLLYVTVWEDDWRDRRTIVEEMIRHKLGVPAVPRVYARNTAISEVSSSEAQLFMQDHHIQGHLRANKYYGLRMKRDRDSSLVAVLSVTAPGKASNKWSGEVEIVRYATDRPVVGGFSKLLSHALKQDYFSGATSVKTFVHNDFGSGDVYRKSGFVLEDPFVAEYFYIKDKKRVHRQQFQRHKFFLREDLKSVPGMSERELAELNGLTRVWSAGNSKWRLDLPPHTHHEGR